MPTYDNKDFLNKIMQLESSGGKNMNHQPIQEGLQAGTTAIGRYGLLPNTVKELINHRRQNGTITQDLQDLDQMPPDQMKQHIEQNPQLEDELANQLATKVIHNQGGDADRAAYSWKQGDNLTPQQIPDDKLKSNDYVQKFRRLYQVLQPNQPDSDDDNGL